MSRYKPLSVYLSNVNRELVPMTFADIESVIGLQLPASALRHRAWWSNNPSNSVMTKAWLDAGYRSEQVDMDARRLVFRRTGQPTSSEHREEPTLAPPVSYISTVAESPNALEGLYGALAGTLTIKNSSDIISPTSNAWNDED